MHLDTITTTAPGPSTSSTAPALTAPVAAAPDGDFAARLRVARREDDIDGDGKVSPAEALVVKLRQLADQLVTMCLLPSSSPLERARAGEAATRILRMSSELAQRIADEEPITEQDLVDVMSEASAIAAWAHGMGKVDAESGDLDDDPKLDGRIDWNVERQQRAAMFRAASGALAARLSGDG